MAYRVETGASKQIFGFNRLLVDGEIISDPEEIKFIEELPNNAVKKLFVKVEGKKQKIVDKGDING